MEAGRALNSRGQTEVAVVSPCTSGAGGSCGCSGLGLDVPFQIEAAPRKPTPDGIAADTRDESQDIGPSLKAHIDASVKTHEPRHTSAIVRMPAGRSARRRSHPMIEPSASEASTRTLMSHSNMFNPPSTA